MKPSKKAIEELILDRDSARLQVSQLQAEVERMKELPKYPKDIPFYWRIKTPSCERRMREECKDKLYSEEEQRGVKAHDTK